MASAHVDWRGRILIALIAAAGALAVLVCVAPAFAADPAPDPPPTEPAHTPDPPPVPPEPQSSPPEPAPAPSPSPPANSSSSSSTQASGSVASSAAKSDRSSAKGKHGEAAHRQHDLQGRSEALPTGKWQRARNDAFAAALTLPAGASQAVVVRATLSPSSSSAPFLPAALAAALATLLLAATPSYALNASRVFRPVEERRFELATIGVCILVGIVVATGLPA